MPGFHSMAHWARSIQVQSAGRCAGTLRDCWKKNLMGCLRKQLICCSLYLFCGVLLFCMFFFVFVSCWCFLVPRLKHKPGKLEFQKLHPQQASWDLTKWPISSVTDPGKPVNLGYETCHWQALQRSRRYKMESENFCVARSKTMNTIWSKNANERKLWNQARDLFKLKDGQCTTLLQLCLSWNSRTPICVFQLARSWGSLRRSDLHLNPCLKPWKQVEIQQRCRIDVTYLRIVAGGFHGKWFCAKAGVDLATQIFIYCGWRKGSPQQLSWTHAALRLIVRICDCGWDLFFRCFVVVFQFYCLLVLFCSNVADFCSCKSFLQWHRCSEICVAQIFTRRQLDLLQKLFRWDNPRGRAVEFNTEDWTHRIAVEVRRKHCRHACTTMRCLSNFVLLCDVVFQSFNRS